MFLFAWVSAAFAVAPITMNVPSDVTKVELVCASKTLTATPSGGVATFAELPTGCKILFTRPVTGTIDGGGVYTCTHDGCAITEMQHLAVTNAPGRVNILIAGTYDTKWMELTCATDGYRQRGDIVENTTTFNDVKASDCQLFFKGGSPAQFRPVVAGTTYRCTVTGTTASCAPYKL